MCSRPRRLAALLLSAAAGFVAPVRAGMVVLEPGGAGDLTVSVESLQEAKFRSIIRQKYDFSCGSAALATLLTYHYADSVREDEVFRVMFEQGDKQKIKLQGFSLLDMKRYLAAKGYDADGFQVTLDAIRKERLPAIALLERDGYRHFVVVKGIDDRDVMVSDPSIGTTWIERDRFQAMWNGVAFLIRNHADVARASFGREKDWRARKKLPVREAIEPDVTARLAFILPQLSDF